MGREAILSGLRNEVHDDFTAYIFISSNHLNVPLIMMILYFTRIFISDSWGRKKPLALFWSRFKKTEKHCCITVNLTLLTYLLHGVHGEGPGAKQKYISFLEKNLFRMCSLSLSLSLYIYIYIYTLYTPTQTHSQTVYVQ
jgi:hypothetical protein